MPVLGLCNEVVARVKGVPLSIVSHKFVDNSVKPVLANPRPRAASIARTTSFARARAHMHVT